MKKSTKGAPLKMIDVKLGKNPSSQTPAKLKPARKHKKK
jgi:hypothetical protein